MFKLSLENIGCAYPYYIKHLSFPVSSEMILSHFIFQVYYQTSTYIKLLTPCQHWILVPAYSIKSFSWRNQRGESTYHPTPLLSFDTNSLFQANLSDNPLALWDVDQTYAHIELLDPSKVIRVKPMRYSPQDRTEFETQLQELSTLNLIRPSQSPHSSPAFMVRNHAEQKRGKARMVVNYKQLNQYTKFDGYFLPHKETLINLTRGKQRF